MIDILVVRPGEASEWMQIPNTLKAMQKIVDGKIELVRLWDNDVAVVCNEEALLMDLPPNRIVCHPSGNVWGLLCGTFFLCLAPRNSEVFMSLPPMLGEMYEGLMKKPVCVLEVQDE